jgi:ribosomal-protein-alanine N-acetyltransferase
MASSPVLHGPSVTLQPFSEAFISPTYVGWLNNAELMQFSRQRLHTHTIESCLQFFRSFQHSPNYFWAIVASELGHIGNLTANVDNFNRVADLTIMVGDPRARGTGLAHAAWQTAMDYLLGAGSFRKVTAGTMSCNVPMVKLMQRSGMEPDGCRQRQFLYGAQEVDCVMYARFASPRQP